ncbi:hypothetical protein [Azospirillum endophyticum]
MSATPEHRPPRRPLWRRVLRRGPWENAAMAAIGAGAFMLMQPFSLTLYGWSFLVILAGTAGFVIVSHFPE